MTPTPTTDLKIGQYYLFLLNKGLIIGRYLGIEPQGDDAFRNSYPIQVCRCTKSRIVQVKGILKYTEISAIRTTILHKDSESFCLTDDEVYNLIIETI